MKKLLHPIYVAFGHIICRFFLIKTKIYDKIHPIETDTVLFVTHPDDDTLFFHQSIKEYNPYIALMVTGWSIKRLSDFKKTMNYYGVRFRAYDTNENSKKAKRRIQKQISEVLELKDFKRCLTHNSEGEYGHKNHQLVHNCVVELVDFETFVPASVHDIEKYPIDVESIKEKEYIFNNFYKTETFVLEQYSVWVNHEKLFRYE